MQRGAQRTRLEYQDATSELLDQQESLQLKVEELEEMLNLSNEDLAELREYKATNKVNVPDNIYYLRLNLAIYSF